MCSSRRGPDSTFIATAASSERAAGGPGLLVDTASTRSTAAAGRLVSVPASQTPLERGRSLIARTLALCRPEIARLSTCVRPRATAFGRGSDRRHLARAAAKVGTQRSRLAITLPGLA